MLGDGVPSFLPSLVEERLVSHAERVSSEVGDFHGRDYFLHQTGKSNNEEKPF